MPPSKPPLRDGQALDRLVEQSVRWARSYAHLDDESRWQADFDAKFGADTARLARECTAPARRFTLFDWVVGVALWTVLGGIVYAATMMLMQPQGMWGWFAVGAGAAVFVVGLGYIYFETTTEWAARRRLAQKERWLAGAASRQAFDVLRRREAR